MNTYPWPTSLGPTPVAVVDNQLVYTEPPRRRFCDDPAVIDHYLRNGQYELAGRLIAASRGLPTPTPAPRPVAAEQTTTFHEPTEDCVCGPTSQPVPRDDGSVGYVIVHHSLDGRERDE